MSLRRAQKAAHETLNATVQGILENPKAGRASKAIAIRLAIRAARAYGASRNAVEMAREKASKHLISRAAE